MDTPIVISPSDMWSMVIAICAAIITISGACTAIALFINKVRAPEKKQNARIEALEKEVADINSRLDKGNKRFDKDYERIIAMETSTKITNRIIVESLQTLVSHAIDGNNIEGLKATKRSLDEYLLSKM